MKTSVGILAIGNEVVDGQITNRNASWLSEKLDILGASPLFHLSCRDEDKDIQEALQFLEKRCHLIVVTGGLGPTRDDFTRNSLSRWLGAPLQLNEECWRDIQKKLNDRQLTIREGHKNQALIPEGATILKNRVGVAPGFFIKGSTCFLAALPGPPNEMQSMFEEELKGLILSNLRPSKNKKLQTWICLGAPESELAHITESILGGGFDIGYRIHRPYVEVKVWATDQQEGELAKQTTLLEEKLKPWFVSYSISDIRNNFADHLKKFKSVFVIDQLTSGLFLQQIGEGPKIENLRYQCFEHQSFRYFSKEEASTILSHMGIGVDQNSLFISLFPSSYGSCLIGLNDQLEKFELPRKIPLKSRLGQLYVIENAVLKTLNF